MLADHAETGTPVSVGGVNQFVTVDLTTLVRDWVDFIATSGGSGRANNGVALVSHSRLSAEFHSKESDSTSHDAALEIVLTGGSGVGPTGPIGPAGAVGPGRHRAGRSGRPNGSAGAVGPHGPTGAAGPAGVTGPAGSMVPLVAGTPGPAGPAGPQGLAWQGDFSSSTNYSQNDAVHFTDDGSSYLCVNAAGCVASLSPAGNSDWGLVVEGGETGPIGPQDCRAHWCSGPCRSAGPAGRGWGAGPAGPPGLPGGVGATGAAGPPGLQGGVGDDGSCRSAGPAGRVGLTGPAGPQGRSA